jgi:hypothetical protein
MRPTRFRTVAVPMPVDPDQGAARRCPQSLVTAYGVALKPEHGSRTSHEVALLTLTGKPEAEYCRCRRNALFWLFYHWETGEDQMATITGGCLCGRVRYTVTGDPALAGICHCRNCQRYTGSSFEAVMAFPPDAVNVQGEVKTYQDTGDSGQPVYRRFCPNCGSGLIAEADALPGLKIVLVGTLDDPSVFKPTMELYCSSAQPWVHATAERTRFPKMPS